MEKKYKAEVNILHYHCDLCGYVMQYKGVEMFSKFQHVCTNTLCTEKKLLDKVYPLSVVELDTPKPIKNGKETAKTK